MATSKKIKYAPQVEANLTIEAIQFSNNNVVGYFNYPMSVPTYKDLSLKDGIHQSKSLPKGKPTDPQDTERNKYLVVMGLPVTNPHEGADTKYYVNKTQSTRFEMLYPGHNKARLLLTWSRILNILSNHFKTLSSWWRTLRMTLSNLVMKKFIRLRMK
nr:hypothetical protein [Tanacetum cinerariifolium]